MTKYNIAVAGATGNIGRLILSMLKERNFPCGDVYALASRASLGKEVSFGENDILKVQALENFDFSQVDLAFFALNNDLAQQYIPNIAKQGCIVIDNSSQFRMDDQVPLIIPEVNAADIVNHKNIIANPNCAVLQLVVALKPLHDVVPIKRVVISTYQSTSGVGKLAMDELYSQTKAIYVFQDLPNQQFPRRIAFNLIPQVDSFLDNGMTKEELKIIQETKKILDPNIELSVTCVRVPVFVGHSESINIEFERFISAEEVIEILSSAPGVVVAERSEDYFTPVECVEDDAVFVSRVRQDPSLPNAINMWVVSDNLRKGGALNAVQIAELLLNEDPEQR